MRKLLHFLIFILPLTASAQQANVWIFGDSATLDFNFEPPREISASYVAFSEGPSSICDEYGNLLLYTDGQVLYNSKNQLIAEGLNGDLTSKQAALIMPHPTNRNIYYIFTVSPSFASGFETPGYYYSVADITLNDGKGGLLQKNVFLHNNGSEKLTAIQSDDCKFSWILTQEVHKNVFYAYRLDENGVHKEPVVSPGGKKYISKTLFSPGALSISPDGTKVAHTVWSYGGQNGIYGWLELFDFDLATGMVSNPRMIHDGNKDTFTYSGFYSTAFSPDSKVLYACLAGFRPVQIDLRDESLALKYFTDKSIRSIQTGPGAKLYAILNEPDHRDGGEGQENLNGYGTTISAIHEPNQLGEACQFDPYYFKLTKGYVVQGLPNFPQSFFYNDSLSNDFVFQDNCLGAETDFSIELNNPVNDFWWNFGDPASGNENSSKEENPSHLFAKSDEYQVQLHSIDICLREDVVEKEVIIYPNPHFSIDFDTLQRCYFEEPYLLNLPKYEFTDYYINNNPAGDTIKLEERGNYEIDLKNECFSQSDRFFFDLVPELSPPLAADTFFCEGEIGILSARNDLAEYLWNTGERSKEIEVYEDGEYSVELSSACQTLDDITNVKFLSKEIERYAINVFTPNGDNINEVFENYAVFSPNYRTRIFNRWGDMIFESTNPEIFWDGTVNGIPSATGVYYYYTETMNCQAQEISLKGSFSLLK